MDAVSSWQAVLTQLEGSDSSRQRDCTWQAARTPPPQVGRQEPGQEAFYTPDAAHQGTPVDAWHSIINTLTGNGKAAHTRLGGSRGSPQSSSVASPRPAAAAAAGQASPGGSPGRVRQLFGSTHHSSSSPGQANSSTGSNPRLGRHKQQEQQQQRVNSSPPKPSSLGCSPTKAGANCRSPRQKQQQHSSPPSGASDTQQLAARLNNLRASAESVLRSASQTAGASAGQPDTALDRASRPSRSCSNAAATPSAGAAGVAAMKAAQQEPGLPRQLFQSPPRAAVERSGSANGKQTSPLQRLLQSQQHREPCVPVTQSSSGQVRAAAAPTQQQVQQATLQAMQPLLQLQQQQQQQAGQLQQQEALQQLVLQQQMLIQQLLPLVQRSGSMQQADCPAGIGTSMGQQGSHAAAAPGHSLHSLQPAADVAVAVSQTQAAAAGKAAGAAGGTRRSPRQRQSPSRAAVLPGAHSMPRRVLEGSLATPALTERQAAEAAPAAADKAQHLATGQQSAGSARASPRSGSSRERAVQDAASAVLAALERGETAVARQAGLGLLCSDSSSGGSSCWGGPGATGQGLGGGSSAGGGCGGSSSANGSEEGAAAAAAAAAVADAAAGGSSARLRRRWHLQQPDGDGDLGPGGPAQPAPSEAAAVDVEQPTSGGPVARHAAASRSANAAATQPSQPAAGRASWSAAGSKSLPAGAGTAVPRHDPGRFASRHASSSSGYSSLAQQLGLPQVVRFSGGGASTGGQQAGSSDSGTPAASTDAACAACADAEGSQLAAAAPAAAAGTLQQGGLSSDSQGSAATVAASDISREASSEPETPTAALPRVHTPGKAAAEVAAELTTPQLAHSAAAVMTVSEAWREEASGAQQRWQQLLDEWSASELDTWEAQRLTEQSAVLGSQSSRMSAPGLTFAQVSAGGVVQRGDAAAQQHDEQQQQQQGGSSQQPEQDAVSAAPVLDLSQLVAGAGQQQAQGQQQAVQGETAVVGSAEDEPAQSQGGCCEEQQPQQEPEPEQEMQQLTFARLAQHDYLSPRKIPAGSAGAAATVPGGAGPAGVTALEAESSEASLLGTAVPPEQQQQQEEEEAQLALPSLPSLPSAHPWLDTTRKQLFTSSADGAGSSSRSSSSIGDLSAAQTGGAAVESRSSSRASSAQSPPEPAAGDAMLLPAAAVAGGSRPQQHKQQQLPSGDGQQQQQSLEQQENEGLERLSQLLHELHGSVHMAAALHEGSIQGGPAVEPCQSQQEQQHGVGEAPEQPSLPQHLQECGHPLQQQQAGNKQEVVGLERLDQLLQELQGLKQSLANVSLGQPKDQDAAGQQPPTGDTGPAPSSAAAAAPAEAEGLGAADSPAPEPAAAAAAAPAALTQSDSQQLGQQLPAAAAGAAGGSQPIAAHQPAPQQPALPQLGAPSAPEGRAAAAVVGTSPSRQSAVPAPSVPASTAISQLKQQLQDSRAALQAIATPLRPSKPAGGMAVPRNASPGASLSGQEPSLEVPAVTTAAAQGWGSGGARHGSSSVSPSLGAAPGLVTNWALQHQQQQQQPGGISGPQQQHVGARPASTTTESAAYRTAGAAAAADSAGAASAWLTGGVLQQYVQRRLTSTAREGSRQQSSAAGFAAGAAGSAAMGSVAGSHVQALVRKWRARAAADGGMQQPQAAAPWQQQHPPLSALQQQQQQQQPWAGEPMQPWQTLQAQAQGAVGKQGASPAGPAGVECRTPPPQWLSTAAPASLGRASAGAATPGLGSASAASLQTPLFGAVPAGQRDSSTGRGMSAAAYSSGGRRSGSSGGLPGGAPAQAYTPVAAAVTAVGRAHRTPSSAGLAVPQGLVSAGSSSSRSRGGARAGSGTPPSTGTIARWAREGSPTRQLRQQLQAAAQDFQQQQQERQQQQQVLQVTPPTASLLRSLATLDQTLAELRSVSPAVRSSGQHSATSGTPGFGMGVGRSDGSSRGEAAALSSGQKAEAALAGAAAAAESVRAGLSCATAAGPASPLLRLREQQQLMAGMGAHMGGGAAAGTYRHLAPAASHYCSSTWDARR